MIYNIKIILFFTLFIFNTNTKVLAFEYKLSKKNIAKINDMLVYDLFLNLEFSEGNSNLSTIIDFVPSTNKKNINKIELFSNLGGCDQKIIYLYSSSKLVKIYYAIDCDGGKKDYNYVLEYNDKLLKKIKVNGKLKYLLNYKSNGLLDSYTLTRNNNSYIFALEYSNDYSSAKLRFDTILNGKVKIGHEVHKNKLNWNQNYKLTDYEILTNKVSSIKYNAEGDIISFKYNDVLSSHEVQWQYTYDNNNNWTKRIAKG